MGEMTLTDESAGVGLPVGIPDEEWADPDDPAAASARYHEYTSAADPIGSGYTPVLSVCTMASGLVGDHPTGIEHFDLSDDLGVATPGVSGPATSPALLASFLHILPGEVVTTEAIATSELHIVLRGRGETDLANRSIRWASGDVVVFPAGLPAVHRADDVGDPVVIYRVTDEPLLRYLGVVPTEARFAPTRWSAADIRRELDTVAADPAAANRNRVSILLASEAHPQTLTATHVLWAMYGLLPVGAVQRAHRHQSVALDLIVECEPGCFTLVGHEVDPNGDIVEPQRVDWEPGGAFVTPPGMWHAHFNESGAPARLFPVQDAGLHTYLRSLDIRFVRG